DVQHLERHRSGLEIAPGAGLPPPFDPEQLRVERHRLVEIPDLDVEAEELRHVGTWAAPFRGESTGSRPSRLPERCRLPDLLRLSLNGILLRRFLRELSKTRRASRGPARVA